jgi:hypothetical protein
MGVVVNSSIGVSMRVHNGFERHPPRHRAAGYKAMKLRMPWFIIAAIVIVVMALLQSGKVPE